jgi:hypothetical protein
MYRVPLVSLGLAFLPLIGFLGCFDLSQNSDADGGTSAASGGDGGGTTTVTGGNCGVEPNTGMQLCQAVSTCPNVVIDTQSMPHCGFRIRGSAVDLVCGCGTAICPLGVFTTCDEAASLIANQTEQGVCVQVAESRCVESANANTSTTTGNTATGKNPACDQQCMTDCGGGEACASVCNCD